MNKLFYPAVFHIAEEGGFWISFPDFPECFTQGDNMQEAYEMAVECLGLGIVSRKEGNETMPQATEADKVKLAENETLVVVEFDMLAYQKKHSGKSVKKTLSIPEWLNEEACALNINFSQVLQEALLNKIRK